jgi:hypothetical protein
MNTVIWLELIYEMFMIDVACCSRCFVAAYWPVEQCGLLMEQKHTGSRRLGTNFVSRASLFGVLEDGPW